METTKTQTSWMAIELDFKRTGDEVVFIITFANVSDAAQELVFSNRAHKAELLGLRLFDAQARRVEPSRKFILKPLPDPDGRRLLPPGGRWSYELKGTLSNGVLDFPATTFPLVPNQPYKAQFVYKLVPSNEVHFTP